MENNDIHNVMHSILSRLMPVCEKEADPKLWLVYDHMQAWALIAERKLPVTDAREPGATLNSLHRHLKQLSDRKLASEITRLLSRYTPQAALAH